MTHAKQDQPLASKPGPSTPFTPPRDIGQQGSGSVASKDQKPGSKRRPISPIIRIASGK